MMNTKTVLICDDDEGILDVVRIVLEERGYDVVTVMNSNDVMDEIKRFQPKLVLLDLWMPGLTGEQVIERMKNTDHARNIPVIIVSANKDCEQVAAMIGADGYICKPFDIDHLETVVDQYVPISVL